MSYKFYKIKFGFENQETISITSDELEKAIYAQITGKVGVFNNGVIRGSNIISIVPDFHKIMGWNDGYELQTEDFQEINNSKICHETREFIGETKDRVNYLLNSGKENLIGKNVVLPEFDKPQELKQLSTD